MTLDELAIKYGSDKSSMGHNYCPFYEKYLPKEPKRILEIGVKEGASIAMWAEYFPNTEVHGLDLFAGNNYSSVLAYLLSTDVNANNNVVLHQGDQRDWKILEELRKYDFDVIIDDGSHNARDQMMTFFGLFNGKHYFIEDTHCNEEEFYSQELPPQFRANNLFSYASAYSEEYDRGELFSDHQLRSREKEGGVYEWVYTDGIMVIKDKKLFRPTYAHAH